MDHHSFVTSLQVSTRTTLITKSNRAGLIHLAGHAGAIILCGALIAAGVPGWSLLIPLQGVLIVFLFTLEHECTHKTPFASARLNDAIGHICGFALLLPFTWFRYFHLTHHRHTNITGQDPELVTENPQTRQAWAWHVSGLPYWAANALLIILSALGRTRAPYLPPATLPRIRREASVMITLYLFVIASLFLTPMLFWVWLLPALMGQPALRLYLLAEHGDCPRVANMFENTRTTTTTALVRFIAWNMSYHTEHHVYPAVPFHQLPALHHAMKAHLCVTAPGYAAFFTKAYLARR